MSKQTTESTTINKQLAMEARKSEERMIFDDEAPTDLDIEDSSNSFDAFTCHKPPILLTGLPVGTTLDDDDDDTKSLSKSLHGQDYDTPRIKKSQDFMHQPVRRRLIFSSQDENESIQMKKALNFDKEQSLDTHGTTKVETSKTQLLPCHLDPSCDNSLQAPVIKSVTKTVPKQIKQQEVNKKTGSRRIAQLVVWTKNPGKELSSNQEKDPVPAPAVPIPLNTGNSNSEGNLFFVQYPIHGPSNAKRKAPKRLKKSPSKKSRRKSAHKKRTTVQQGSTAGRAYRTYLHTCLERQRQQVRCDSDFKVEKLFQPERGVALPGEVSSSTTSTCAPIDQPAATTTSVSSAPESDTNNISAFPSSATPPCPVANEQDRSPKLADLRESFNTEKICGGGGDINTEGENNERAGGSSEITIFELPESFTVTTDTANANEFDLLIQNVVHEEMVDIDDEEDLMGEKFENGNKRMRMSTGTGSVSSEDSMSMYESGKPRCTYTELIEKALTESGGLTVSEIYTWISDRYPFFKPDDDRWKNSVRHNLSINPYFKKGEKARSGAGHLWTISEKSKGCRSSLVSWDERRKSPCDPLEIDMPMESETDRAVANILGQYLSECRANREASAKDKNDSDTSSSETGNEQLSPFDTPSQSTPNSQPETSVQMDQQETQVIDSGGVNCDTVQTNELGSFNLNELNSGQFTVDLAGINIPEGGSINFEELMNAGRLIYIQTDPDANKENDSSQAVILNECMLPELSTLTNNAGPHDDTRFNSFYSDPLSVDLGFGKGDSLPSVSFANDVSHLSYTATTFTTGSVGNCQDVLGTCGQLVPQSEISAEQHHQDLTVLDQVIPMPYEEVMIGSGANAGGLSDNLPPLSSAALYESKELGISYTYQTEPSNHDIL